MASEDGGPAFPVNGPNGNHPGMSLREWLAGQAMVSLVANAIKRMEHACIDPPNRTGMDDHEWDDSESTWAQGIATEAFIVADAMLAARKEATDGNRD